MKSKTIILLLLTSSAFGQVSLVKGIYRGTKLPFLDCYLNIKDTVATIEIFNYKGGQYFYHAPTKKLTPPVDQKIKNLILIGKHDSVAVYKDKSNVKAKIKGYGTVKMHYTNLNDSAISKNINNNLAFRTYQDTRKELKTRPSFNDSIYDKTFHSYNFDSNLNLNNQDFRKLCKDFETEIKSKWQ